MATFYAIRHKATGELMPQCKRRGYSHWNPTTGKTPMSATATPRLLATSDSARRCIVQWNACPNSKTCYDHDGEYDLDIKQDGRSIDDLEVVAVRLTTKEAR